KWLGPVAKDLAANRGKALGVVGARQPASLHVLAHAINAALGAPQPTILRAPVADADERDAATDIKALTDAMAAGQVDALVMLGSNPVYDAPSDVGFGDQLSNV